jgi:two-component system sensor histidine kinase/response regulator
VHQGCASGWPFQIILLDMRMPGMDGLEVARRIREDHLPIEPLILMLSSDDLEPQIDRPRELTLDAYLVKPITRKQLFEAIHRVLAESNRNGTKPIPQWRPVERPTVPAGNLRKKRLLVAEDAPDNRVVISAFLRHELYEIDFAENGEITVERFQAQSHDAVLMDIQMPKMDGLAATCLIRQWEREHGGAHTPIIALTASVLEEDVRQAATADSHFDYWSNYSSDLKQP